MAENTYKLSLQHLNDFVSDAVNTAIRFLFILVLLLTMTRGAWATPLLGSGTQADPYLISSAADWNEFCDNIATYKSSYIKMTADVSCVSKMAGTDAVRFGGTFDGDGYTLNVSISVINDNNDDARYVAPFSRVQGATIKNLKVTGSVTASGYHTAGLIGWAGDCTIKNVVVSATVTNNYHPPMAGFIGTAEHVSSHENIYFTDCLFNGKLVSSATNSAAGYTQKCGGFIGWNNQGTPIMTRCLFDGSEVPSNGFHPIAASSGMTSWSGASATKVYYTVAAKNYGSSSPSELAGESMVGKSAAEIVSAMGTYDTNTPYWQNRLKAACPRWGDITDGPWTFDDVHTGFCITTDNATIRFNRLNNSGKANYLWHESDGIGFTVDDTRLGGTNKNAVYSTYTCSQSVPAFTRKVLTWNYDLKGYTMKLYQKTALYAADNLATLKETEVDFTYNNTNASAGSDYYLAHLSQGSGHTSGKETQSLTKTFEFDNRSGDTEADMQWALLMTHVIENNTGSAVSDIHQWGGFQTTSYSWATYYYKTVTFNANGGSGSMEPQTVENSSKLTTNTFTRVGYTFAGWSTTTDGDKEYNDAGTITATESSKGPVTLYAKWTENPTHDVTFADASATTQGWSTSPTNNVREGKTVTVSYSGEHKVKSVTVKGISTVTLSPTSLTFSDTEYKNATKTFTVIRDGDGAITATSSNENVATVTVSGNTVTVKREENWGGKATITVNVAATASYAACSTTLIVENRGVLVMRNVSSKDIGKIIGSDGFVYDHMRHVSSAGTRGVAMIVYVGDGDTSDNYYNHGLAIALREIKDPVAWGEEDGVHIPSYNMPEQAMTDLRGIDNTEEILAKWNNLNAAWYCRFIATDSRPYGSSNWFLPSQGQIVLMLNSFGAGYGTSKEYQYYNTHDAPVRAFLQALIDHGIEPKFEDSTFWTSTQVSNDHAGIWSTKDGSFSFDRKTSKHRVIPMFAF